MTDEEFISLLEQQGAAIQRWPAPLPEQAVALLEGSAKARANLKAMQDLEEYLAHSRPVPSMDAAALASRASQARQAARPIMGPGLRKLSFAVLGVATLAAGILVGITPPSDGAIVGSVQMALNGGSGDVW